MVYYRKESDTLTRKDGKVKLEILTRHILSRDITQNLLSVQKLVRYLDGKLQIEQTVLVDHYQRGIGRSHTEILRSVKPRGDYVFILDDDDVVVNLMQWGELAEVLNGKPEVVSVGMKHREGILPVDSESTGHGTRGISSVIVKSTVFDMAKFMFAESYDGAWPFIHEALLYRYIIFTNLILSMELE